VCSNNSNERGQVFCDTKQEEDEEHEDLVEKTLDYFVAGVLLSVIDLP
jgi:hypothetical protein